MLWYDAIRWARNDMGYSQKRLAELAKVQRRQLATLESGGNVTLSTLRKVLAQLPNLTSFELDGVQVDVPHPDPLSDPEYYQTLDMMFDAFQGLAKSLIAHRKSSPRDIAALRAVNMRFGVRFDEHGEPIEGTLPTAPAGPGWGGRGEGKPEDDEGR
ncbi:MAG TPA: helix-turn-helix domain-containing protein [Thermoanaerobaculia bacterium]|nr:helix-turn-helix domain-containing protein [Thermoanaerobaculia bacterium]